MKQRVLVVGLAGVGKTTVINEFLKIASAEGLPVTDVNYGTVMMNIAKGIVKNRDEIRHLSTDAQRELQIKAAKTIFRKSKPKEVLLVDTHLIVRTTAGYLPGIPQHVLTAIKPDLIAVVETSPEELVRRRSSDDTRNRKDMLVEDVRDEIMISRAMASASATIAGTPMALIRNDAERPEKAAEQLLAMIKG